MLRDVLQLEAKFSRITLSEAQRLKTWKPGKLKRLLAEAMQGPQTFLSSFGAIRQHFAIKRHQLGAVR